MDGPPALAERKGGGGGGVFSLPPGQSDEFSRLKAEGRLCFLGAPWSPWSLEATGTSPQLITGGDFTPDPEFKKTEPRSVYEICAYFFFFFSFSASVNGSVCVSYLAGGQQVYVGMQPRDTSRESNSGSVPGTSSAQSSARCHDWLDLL